MTKIQITKRIKRHKRVRAKIFGTALRPRLSVFRSNKQIYAQLIDDEEGKTIIGLARKSIKLKKKTGKSDVAYETGKMLAKAALEKGIKIAVFDRGGYVYSGRVKKVAEGAREGGLKI